MKTINVAIHASMASLTASTQQKPIQWIKSTLISVNQRSKFDWIRATKVAANKRLTPLVHFQSPLNNSSICFLFGCVDVSRFCLHRPRNKTTAKQKKNVFPSMPTKLPDNSLPRLLKNRQNPHTRRSSINPKSDGIVSRSARVADPAFYLFCGTPAFANAAAYH